jgi:hypothetical protein
VGEGRNNLLVVQNSQLLARSGTHLNELLSRSDNESFIVQSLLDSIAGRLTGNSILNSNATSGEESLQNLETLKSLADKVDAAGKARLALSSEWKPRIERLADKYDLEGLERELFTCSFVMQVSSRRNVKYAGFCLSLCEAFS